MEDGDTGSASTDNEFTLLLELGDDNLRVNITAIKCTHTDVVKKAFVEVGNNRYGAIMLGAIYTSEEGQDLPAFRESLRKKLPHVIISRFIFPGGYYCGYNPLTGVVEVAKRDSAYGFSFAGEDVQNIIDPTLMRIITDACIGIVEQKENM